MKTRKSVFCIAKTEQQANMIAEALRDAGFSSDDISALFPDRAGSRDFAHEHHTKAPEGGLTGSGAGVVIGGALGWLVGIGSLAIPGLGPFIAAGPIMALLAGAGAGAVTGGIIGALVGMGMPEYEAKRYEGKIRDGNILLSVHADTTDEVSRAKQIMKDCKAEDISHTGEKGVSEERRAERSH